MKKTFLISTLIWLVLNAAYAQIDNSIPTPPDLQAQGTSIRILNKDRLKDGTIVIRYVNKQGRTMQRRTHPSKPGEKQEWDEANPPERPDKSNPGTAVGRTSSDGPAAAAGQSPDNPAGAKIGGLPVGPLGEVLPGKPPGPGLPGSIDSTRVGGTPARLPGGIPPAKPVPNPSRSALDDVRKGAEGILPDHSTPGKPSSVLDEAGKAVKKIAEDILKAISNLQVTHTAGTGETIGVIANITLKNNNDFPVGILPQTFYIPSDGKYQNYVGRIPEGIIIPPDSTVVVPVNGVCADIHTPPVPPEENMPPVSTWVPVGSLPPDVLVDSKPPGASDPLPPKGISDPPNTTPIPDDPAGGDNTPKDIIVIPIVNTVPVPDFTPSDIPHIITTSDFKPVDTPDEDIIITWPGTNTPVSGTIVPGSNPEVFGPVIVKVLEEIEKAVEVIQEGESFPTPFSHDSVREEKALVQQTFWIINSILTGNEYTKEDFTGNTYEQFQTATGKPVSSLAPEQKEQVDAGITDFWNAFHATGIVAKVISAESPGIDTENADQAVLASNDPLDDWEGYDEVPAAETTDQVDDEVVPNKVEEKEEESPFKCVCPDTISFKLEVYRGQAAVAESLIALSKDSSLTIRIDKLKWQDELDFKATNIDINCQCAGTSCDVAPIFFPNGNEGSKNNCEEIGANWTDAAKIKVKPMNNKDGTIFIKFFLFTTCNAEGCKECECYREIKLILKDSRSK